MLLAAKNAGALKSCTAAIVHEAQPNRYAGLESQILRVKGEALQPNLDGRVTTGRCPGLLGAA
jgi:hypothetical protein